MSQASRWAHGSPSPPKQTSHFTIPPLGRVHKKTAAPFTKGNSGFLTFSADRKQRLGVIHFFADTLNSIIHGFVF